MNKVEPLFLKVSITDRDGRIHYELDCSIISKLELNDLTHFSSIVNKAIDMCFERLD